MASPKFHEDLEWLIPHYESVLHMLPRHTLTKVQRIPLHQNKIQRVHGLNHRTIYEYSSRGRITHTTKGHTYSISLYTHYWYVHSYRPLKRSRKPYSSLDMLRTFAHELAHIGNELHTPRHTLLENRIMNKFMANLLKEGYTSEEDELSTNC